jgi:hypothetical protein
VWRASRAKEGGERHKGKRMVRGTVVSLKRPLCLMGNVAPGREAQQDGVLGSKTVTIKMSPAIFQKER